MAIKISDIFSKILMAMLLFLMIAGVAVWGINDIIGSNRGKTVAKVGNSKISEAELEQIVQNNKMRLLQNGITMTDEYNAIIKNNALINLIGDRLLKNEFSKLHIELDSKEVLKKDYLSQPDFNKEQLVAIMKSQGGEQAFLNRISQEKKIDILQGSITAIVPITDSEVKNAYNFENQSRDIAYIEITQDAVKDLVKPTDAELTEYYEKNKEMFVSPEFRTVSYVVLADADEDKLNKTLSAVNDKVAGGETLEEISQEYKLHIKTVKSFNSFGKIEDDKPADNLPKAKNFLPAVFATGQGEISESIESNDSKSFIFARVDNVNEKRIRALDEVKPGVIAGWTAQNKALKMVELAKTISDNLKAGKTTFAEVSTKYGLEIKQRAEVTASDKTFAPDITKQIFNTNRGSYSDVIKVNSALMIAQVKSINPAKPADALTLFRYKSKLQEEASREIMAEYLDYLRVKYNVKVYSK